MHQHTASRPESIAQGSILSFDSHTTATRLKYQSLRHERFSYQSPAASVLNSRSVFDISSVDSRSRLASPSKRQVHLLPNTSQNHYEIPVPARLIRPPLIGNGSLSNLASHNNSSSSLVSSIPSLATRPQSHPVSPPKPQSQPRVLPEIPRTPEPPKTDFLPSQQKFGHQKTLSMPAFGSSPSSSSLTGEYTVANSRISASALLDYEELNELGKLQSADQELLELGKKKHRFRFWKNVLRKPKKNPGNVLPIAKPNFQKRPVPVIEDSDIESQLHTEDEVPIIERACNETKDSSFEVSQEGPLLQNISGISSVDDDVEKPKKKPVKRAPSSDSEKSADSRSTVSFKNLIPDHQYRDLIGRSHENNSGFRVKEQGKMLVFSAESESLNMKLSPESRREYSNTSSFFSDRSGNTIYTDATMQEKVAESVHKSDTVIRKPGSRSTLPPLPPRMETLLDDAHSTLSKTSTISSSENDPRVLYSPINDTFSLSSSRTSSFESISSLGTKEMTFSGGYDAFTQKADEHPPNDTILSELLGFEINKEYSLAEDIEDPDKTHILEPLSEEDSEDEEAIRPPSAQDQQLDQALEKQYIFERPGKIGSTRIPSGSSSSLASDYENLIKGYTNEYGTLALPSSASSVKGTSLELIHYYELNSSKSTFKEFREFSGASFGSGVNPAPVYGQDVLTALRIVNKDPSSETGSVKRDFSFASSIASDVQFEQNMAKGPSPVFKRDSRQASVLEGLEALILYYSDSDMVRNPLEESVWESATNSSARTSSGVSTLLSAVNSLYGDYIHQKGYRDVEDMCSKTQTPLQEVIRKIKKDKADELINTGGSVYSSISLVNPYSVLKQ